VANELDGKTQKKNKKIGKKSGYVRQKKKTTVGDTQLESGKEPQGVGDWIYQRTDKRGQKMQKKLLLEGWATQVEKSRYDEKTRCRLSLRTGHGEGGQIN